MKLQKSTWTGIGLILAALAVVTTGFGGGEEAPSAFGWVAEAVKYLAPALGAFLVASDGGKPVI